MKLRWFAVAALTLSLGIAGLAANKAYAAPAAASAAAAGLSQDRDHDQDRDRDHDRDWDAPPSEFRDIQRQGFHDGVEGARKDFGNHRRPDVNNRDEYRHPHVPRDLREDYQEGFRRGYEKAMSHLMGEHGR